MINLNQYIDHMEKMQAQGEIICFRVPGTRLEMLIQKHGVTSAMALLQSMDPDSRRATFDQIEAGMHKMARRVERGLASQREADGFAADCHLYIAHEILFGNGEVLLTKAPDAKAMRGGAA